MVVAQGGRDVEDQSWKGLEMDWRRASSPSRGGGGLLFITSMEDGLLLTTGLGGGL